MFYTYESGGRVSRPISDYRSEVLSGSFAARDLNSFWFTQGPAVPLSDIGGTLAQYADRSIYNTQSYRAGLGILSGAAYVVGQVPFGYVRQQQGPVYTWTTNELDGELGPGRIKYNKPSRLLAFNKVSDSRVYSYHPAIIDLYTEVDFGLITANATSTSNNGLVADPNATLADYGRIYYVTTVESFGFNKVIGAAQAKATNAWAGEGRIVAFGRQTSPAIYGSITDGKVRVSGIADIEFSPAPKGRGVLPLRGSGGIAFVPNWNGSGLFKKFQGSAESITVNPDERQMLFSFTGGLDEKHTEHYHGSGSLKNFSNAVEEKVFAWNGSGTINVRSDKPDLYTLQEIADWILEDIKGRTLASIKYEPSDEKHTESYNESSVDYWSQRDYGFIVDPNQITCVPASGTINTNTVAPSGCIKVDTELALNATYSIPPVSTTPTNFVDWGSITEIASMWEDAGRILDNTDLMPFGGIKIDPDFGCADKFLPSWTSRGSIGRITGVAGVPLDVAIYTRGTFRIYGASITNFSLLAPGDGLFDIKSNVEVAFVPNWNGSGSIKTVSGSAECSASTPPTEQALFKITGGITSEKHTESYVGSGRLRNLATLEAEKGTFDYVGSGTIELRSVKPKLTELSEEKHTESYNESAFISSVEYDYGFIIDPTQVACVSVSGDITSNATAATGCTKVDPGTTLSLNATYTVPPAVTTPTSTLDLGLVSEIASPTWDYGWILGTTAHGRPYGLFDITGGASVPVAANEVSEGGLIKITGKAILPLFASVFSDGLFKIQSDSLTNFSLLAPGDGHIPGMYGESDNAFTPNWNGSGTLWSMGGASETATFNPDEKQMLFSFTGGITSEKHTEAYFGSGRIRNFATIEAEKQSFDWVGTGQITIRSDKPDLYRLYELAEFKLSDIERRWLGSFRYEPSDEKHTECYNLSAWVDFPRLDYGYLVYPALTSCVDISGNITVDTTAPSGCMKVPDGTTLSLDATYTVPLQQTTPTTSIDYDLVSNPGHETLDYGHLLDTPAMSQPFGGIHIAGASASIFQPNWVGRGGLRLENAATTNFSLRHIGSGSIKTVSGSATTFGAAIESTGLFRVGGTSPYAASLGVIGEGRFSTFSGAAESLTFNPEEKQMLFSFTGSAGDPLISYGVLGTGSIKGLSGSYFTETDAYYGSGTIRIRSRKPELSELSDEKHTEVYDLNVCYDPPELDYGLLVDNTLTNCVIVNGTISTNTVATTGCTKVDTTLSLDATYSIPSPTTVPTESYDYEWILNPPDGRLDYGHIWDSTSKLCPFGPISILRGSATTAEVQVYTADPKGVLFTFGDAEIVVPPQWDSPAEPPIKVYGAAIPNFSLRTFGKGRLFGYNGAAECTTSVPPTEQVLFRFVPGPFDRWTTYDWQPSWVSKGGFTIRTEEAKTHWVPHIIGTGSFKKFNGAAESLTFNPEERQMLFSFFGSGGESHTEDYVGSYDHPIRIRRGALSDWDTYDWQPCWVSKGGITIRREEAKTHWVPSIVGTGRIPTFSGAAESLTVNPEERQLLFSILGTKEERISVTETGIGTLRITGDATVQSTISLDVFGRIPVTGVAHTTRTGKEIGSGTLKKFSGVAESITFNPEERQMLFSFTGAGSQTTTVVPPEGSGVLFGFGGASITTAAAYETQGLYKIYGESIIGFSLTHFGSGTFRKFGGSAESITVNPDERQLLFSILGTGSESLGVAETKQIEIDITGKADPVLTTQAFHGSGTIPVVGEANIHYVPHVIGSGTFKKFSGAAESITFNPE